MLGLQGARAEVSDGYAKISDDLTLHYRSSGSGPVTIVFVPGWTMTTDVFEHQLSHLEGSTKFKALTFDPRAQGLSTLTIEGHYYEQHARDLAALLGTVKAGKVVLVGWSSGGGDVLEYVRLFGADKVAGVVLLDTCPKVKGYDTAKEWVWFGTKEEGDQDGGLKFFSYDVMIDRQKVNTEFAKYMLDDPSPKNMAFVQNMTNHTPNAIAALLNTSYWYLDDTAAIEQLDGKVPLLYFTHGDWHDLATAWSEKHTPHAEIVSFGKHLSFWEHPETFNAALDRFLEKVKD